MTNGVTSVGHPEDDAQAYYFRNYTKADWERYHALNAEGRLRAEREAQLKVDLSRIRFTLLNAFERLRQCDPLLPPEFAEWEFEKQCAFINDNNSVPHFIIGESAHKLRALEIELAQVRGALELTTERFAEFIRSNKRTAKTWDNFMKKALKS